MEKENREKELNGPHPCLHCGGTEYRHYDGALGYEAGICKTCGCVYDQSGMHEPDTDPNSVMFVKVDQDALAIRLRMRNKSPEILEALKEALNALNEIPNTKIRSDKFKDSYEVCSHLGKVIRLVESVRKQVPK